MLEPGGARVAIAHRVERRDMNGTMVKDVQLPRKPSSLPRPPPSGCDEPLDLSKPLDLSRKPTAKPNKPDNVVTALNKPNQAVSPMNIGPLGGRMSSRELLLKHQAAMLEMDNASHKVPHLGSTRYPLQRGLAYVQPRQIRQPRQTGANGTAHAPGPQSMQQAKNPSPPERLSPEQLKPHKNYTAMHQRVRAEAANIAALQAQATQAAQAAVSKALARHKAQATQEASPGVIGKKLARIHETAQSQPREALSSHHKVTQQLPQQRPSPTQPQLLHQRQSQPHPNSGHAKIQQDRRKSLPTHSERLAPVKPRQRHLSPEEKAYMMQRHFAQLSARSGIQSEQDLIRAYQSLIGGGQYPSKGARQGQSQKAIPTSSANGSMPEPRKQVMPQPRPRDIHDERDLAHMRMSQSQQKTISDQIAMNKSSNFAAKVKAREQAMINQQREILVRRQRQMLEDVNNNKRKLLEYARKEKEREAMIRDMNLKQYESLAKAQLERYLPKEKLAQKTPQSVANQEYLNAIAAYNAMYTAGQAQAAGSLLGSASPPSAMSVLQKKPSPHIPKRPSSESSNTNQPRSVQSPSKDSHTHAHALKRPATSTHTEAPPAKKQTAQQPIQPAKLITTQSEEARRMGLFQAMMLNSPRENVSNPKTPSMYPSDKKLASMPVKDRLELARRKAERGHREAMFLSKYAELMQTSVLGNPLPESARQRSSSLRGDILRVSDEEKIPNKPTLAAFQNDLAQRINASQSKRASVTTPQTKTSRDSLIDLTGETSAPAATARSPGSLEAHQPKKRERRLPSYDDAVAAQRSPTDKKNETEKISPDEMSSVAKRLVTSSQEWLKLYMTREKEIHSKACQGETVVDKVMNEKDFALRIPRSTHASSIGNELLSTLKLVPKIPPATVNTDSSSHSTVNTLPSPSGHILEIPSKTDSTKEKEVKSEITTALLKKTGPTIRNPGKSACVLTTASVPEKTLRVLPASDKPVVKSTTPIPNTIIPTIKPEVIKATEAGLQQVETKQTPIDDPKLAANVKNARVSLTPLVAKDLLGEEKRHQSVNDLMQADASKLGKEERALQRAILRFNDLGKPCTDEMVQAPEPETKEGNDTAQDNLPTTRVAKRKKRKLSNFRRRIRALRNMASVSGPISGRKRGRPRLSALPRPTSMAENDAAMRGKFQDFVPTILNHRTRNAGLDRIQNYRSMYDARNVRYELEIEKERAKVLERRRRLREYGHNEEETTATQIDAEPAPVPVEADEECAPPVAKRPRGRPRLNKNGGESATSKPVSSDQSAVNPSQPLRVVLDENSSNRIKMKFFKVGGGTAENHAEKANGDLPTKRKRGRPPKSAGKRKTKTRHVEPQAPRSPQPPKLEMMPPHGEDKENESDYEDFVQDPDFDSINPEKSPPEYKRVVRPDPPAEMKKVQVNKKLGETLLHRAATDGSMEMTSYCVDYRVVDINARDNAGYTALHESCVNGYLNIARYLLRHGADVNVSAADGTRPIHDAVDNDRPELVRLLLAYGADPCLPTYTGRTTTKLALARSSEMKTLLFGYLQDVNGDRSKLDDAPAHPLDYQWSFNGSCSLFDSDTDLEMYIFADVPGPDVAVAKYDCVQDDTGIFFESSEKPVLPSFNLRLDGQDKFRNWVLLDQLLDRLSMSREELEASHTSLRPISLPSDQFHQSVQESQVSRSTVNTANSSCDGAINSEIKGENVTLVELDDGLRSVLGVDVEYVR